MCKNKVLNQISYPYLIFFNFLGGNRAVRYVDLAGLAVPTCQVEHSIAGGDLTGLAFSTCQVERGIVGGDLTGLAVPTCQVERGIAGGDLTGLTGGDLTGLSMEITTD